jgi:hypothetical protein
LLRQIKNERGGAVGVERCRLVGDFGGVVN